ncbi:MAG: 16S rRNA (guanine(527)-N(7))-methyltransferase RsmG [Hyphomicrobiales bacterium]|nr:16S rRNA (guanine(527)-N(7))-methyltransferase RsmG [Hyphomicrobiales bacterium]
MDAFVEVFDRWSRTLNLIAAKDRPHLWTRHVADSLQLIRLIGTPRRLVDLGSGGGFPGMIWAVALAGRPGFQVDLVDSDQRKCAFLREAARATGAPARVHAARIDDWLAGWGEPVDAITARALAPLRQLIEWTHSRLTAGATGWFLKGQTVDMEMAECTIYGDFNFIKHASVTSRDGTILEIRRRALEGGGDG